MSTSPKADNKPQILVSHVADNGTIVEALLDTKHETTRLFVGHGASVRYLNEWSEKERTFVPVRATNNLLKHGALLLPSAADEFGDVPGLLEEIAGYVGRYVSLPASAANLAAAYVLLTWVYDAFNELPYLRFRGDYGTGKTRALNVVGSICYKGFFASGASTVSPIFHTLDVFRGTLIFDEADFRFTDEKAELVKILNNGNSKGFPVLRTQVTQQREFNPQAFTIFGPKIVGMRRAYEDRALESRFLTIEMEPGRSSGVPINLPDRQKEEATALRNKLLMYRFRYRHAVVLNEKLADPRLEARINQILLPLLSVVPDEAMRALVLETARQHQSVTISDRRTSTEGELLQVIANLAPDGEAAGRSLMEIANHFATEHETDYEHPIHSRWIGAIIRRLGIQLYKSNGITVIAPGQANHIRSLAGRYGVAVIPSQVGEEEDRGDAARV